MECFSRFEGRLDKQADALSLWIATRSSDLLIAFASFEGDTDSFNADNVRWFRRCPTGKKKKKAGAVLWKTKMPKSSRDMAINRASDKKSHKSWVFRYSKHLLSASGKTFRTLNEAAAHFATVTDSKEFMTQHLLWNCCLVDWLTVTDIVQDSSLASFILFWFHMAASFFLFL